MAETSVTVPLRRVEEELTRQMKELQDGAEAPVQRACMSNLIIYCDRPLDAADAAAQVPGIAASHPARVLLLLGELESSADAPEERGGDGTLSASVLVRRLQTGRNHRSFSEQVTLHATGGAVGKLAFAVRALLIGDLPINLWWHSTQPPPLAGPLLYELAEHAQQIVYDSLGWTEPARAVAATSAWLEQFQQGLPGGRWRVASDLNWRRLKMWRRFLKQALNDAAAPGAIATATELLVEHGPHAVAQAWQLVSWFALQLGWQVQAGNIQEGTQIVWQFEAPHGPIRVTIRRLPEGPPAVLLMRMACNLGNVPGAIVIRLEDSRRLVVEQEGVDSSPRSTIVQPLSVAELVAQQLSDRERAPVFDQSMAVAQELAKSLL